MLPAALGAAAPAAARSHTRPARAPAAAAAGPPARAPAQAAAGIAASALRGPALVRYPAGVGSDDDDDYDDDIGGPLTIEDSYEDDYGDDARHTSRAGASLFGSRPPPARAAPPTASRSHHPGSASAAQFAIRPADDGYGDDDAYGDSYAAYGGGRGGDSDDDNASDGIADSNPLLGMRNPLAKAAKSFAPVDPLFQPLIASAIESQDTSIYIDPEKRPYKDVAITIAYLACLLFMLVWGAVSAAKTGSLPVSSIISRTLYFTFSESAVTVAVLTAVSVAAGAAWLALLSYFARPIIYFTAIAIPSSIMIMSTATFFVSLSASFSPKTPDTLPEIHGMLGVALSGMLTAAWLAYYIWRKRAMVDTMTHIIELSCDILHLNPSLFGLSVALMVGHAIFSVVWIILFSRLFLVGTVQDGAGRMGSSGADAAPASATGSPTFVPSNQTPIIATFFVLMYFWTSAIFQNIEKTTVASVVGGWYFQDMPSSPTHSSDQTWRNFKHVSTRSFGPVAFASLVLGAVRTAKYVISKIRERASRGSSFMRYLLAILSVVSRVLDDFSSYALVNTGLTGDGFIESAHACTRLFRRNLILGLITQGATKVISVLGRILVSAVVGIVVFWTAVGSTSPSVGTGGNEWVAAGVATIVPYYVVGVLTRVVENTVDATFICYLIDLDTNSCHCEGAHRIFSESLS